MTFLTNIEKRDFSSKCVQLPKLSLNMNFNQSQKNIYIHILTSIFPNYIKLLSYIFLYKYFYMQIIHHVKGDPIAVSKRISLVSFLQRLNTVAQISIILTNDILLWTYFAKWKIIPTCPQAKIWKASDWSILCILLCI